LNILMPLRRDLPGAKWPGQCCQVISFLIDQQNCRGKFSKPDDSHTSTNFWQEI
jgi:hypothetical protein